MIVNQIIYRVCVIWPGLSPGRPGLEKINAPYRFVGQIYSEGFHVTMFRNIVTIYMRIIRLAEIARVPASHENPADPGVLKQVLFRKDDLAPGRIQMINWATLLPGKTFRAHYHEDMDEIFIMLDGDVEITVGAEKAVLTKGDTIVISESSVHVMKNLTKRPVVYIAIGIARDRGGRTVVM